MQIGNLGAPTALFAQLSGQGSELAWHLEYVAVASAIAAGVVGVITIWKHAANDFIRITASVMVAFVVLSGVLLATGSVRYRIDQIKDRFHLVWLHPGAPFNSSSADTSRPQAQTIPFYQQSNPPFYQQSNPLPSAAFRGQDTPQFSAGQSNPLPTATIYNPQFASQQSNPLPTVSPSIRTPIPSPTSFGASISNPMGGSISNTGSTHKKNARLKGFDANGEPNGRGCYFLAFGNRTNATVHFTVVSGPNKAVRYHVKPNEVTVANWRDRDWVTIYPKRTDPHHDFRLTLWTSEGTYAAPASRDELVEMHLINFYMVYDRVDLGP
jgi:hypothetical protein